MGSCLCNVFECEWVWVIIAALVILHCCGNGYGNGCGNGCR